MDNDKRITELEAENERLKNEIIKLADENTKLKLTNDWYLEQFRLAQYRRFGASSERTEAPEQLGFFNEAESLTDETKLEPEQKENITYERKRRKGKREEFYDGLPTEQIVHELPEAERFCPECNGPLHACKHEVLRREIRNNTCASARC